MTASTKADAARLVSVIVPTNNRPSQLRLALASIRALEGPDLHFEILVGDNGNAPETPAVAREFDAVYLKTKKNGAGPARNLDLSAATGDYFSFIDDDDIWLPENIRPHLAMLDARPELDAVIGQLICTDKDLNPISGPLPDVSPGEGDKMLREMLGDWFPQVGTTLARMRVRDKVGLFDEKHVHGEDVDWFLRLGRLRTVAFTQTPCILFRGRPPGTYDKLHRSRLVAGRRVFLKHAIPERRIFKSAGDFSRGYNSRMWQFFTYFSYAAEQRAARGERRQAIYAMLTAAYVFPGRALVHLLKRSAMRRALVGILTRGKSANTKRGAG